jgi:hypothetical protein
VSDELTKRNLLIIHIVTGVQDIKLESTMQIAFLFHPRRQKSEEESYHLQLNRFSAENFFLFIGSTAACEAA